MNNIAKLAAARALVETVIEQSAPEQAPVDVRHATLWREQAPKWAASLNRRAQIEQLMFDAACGKRAMPTPAELREWALKLGTPDEAALANSVSGAEGRPGNRG